MRARGAKAGAGQREGRRRRRGASEQSREKDGPTIAALSLSGLAAARAPSAASLGPHVRRWFRSVFRAR